MARKAKPLKMGLNVRLKLNTAGVRELMLGDEIAGDVQRRAKKVAAKAGPGFVAERDMLRRVRAGSRVVTRTEAAKRTQMKHNVLVKSLDAANDR